jgi:hypothetical protein
MNWIYVDKDNYEVKYGVRLEAQPNLTGPFDCTRQDRRLTFEKWEGFVVTKEEEEGMKGNWALYFDRDDDMLEAKLGKGRTVLDVELVRWEKRVRKDRPLGDMITIECNQLFSAAPVCVLLSFIKCLIAKKKG